MSDYCPDCGCKHGCLCGDETPPTKAARSFAAPTGLAGERVCENDFVFLDHAHRPYRVRKSDAELWLYYWSKSKTWVSLRKCTDDEAMQYIEGALKPAMAKHYEAGVPFLAS